MSNSKIITYDLCKNGKNYEGLSEYLSSYSICANITESTWFVSTNKSCTTICEEISKIIDSDDRIFVAELNGNAAWNNINCDDDYLKNNL